MTDPDTAHPSRGAAASCRPTRCARWRTRCASASSTSCRCTGRSPRAGWASDSVSPAAQRATTCASWRRSDSSTRRPTWATRASAGGSGGPDRSRSPSRPSSRPAAPSDSLRDCSTTNRSAGARRRSAISWPTATRCSSEEWQEVATIDTINLRLTPEQMKSLLDRHRRCALEVHRRLQEDAVAGRVARADAAQRVPAGAREEVAPRPGRLRECRWYREEFLMREGVDDNGDDV